jgi:hypothetical protein
VLISGIRGVFYFRNSADIEYGRASMVTTILYEIAVILAVIAIGVAIRKWQIIRDRQMIFAVIGNALRERKALWSGILFGLFYMGVFIILGGKGGRIHVLFGRVIWNTTPGEMVGGLLLAFLVMLSMTLFVYGVRVMGGMKLGRKSGIGFFGSLLALLAAFCP